MKWPLDQVLAAQTLDVTRIKRLSGIGLDHYPVLASICRRNGRRLTRYSFARSQICESFSSLA